MLVQFVMCVCLFVNSCEGCTEDPRAIECDLLIDCNSHKITVVNDKDSFLMTNVHKGIVNLLLNRVNEGVEDQEILKELVSCLLDDDKVSIDIVKTGWENKRNCRKDQDDWR